MEYTKDIILDCNFINNEKGQAYSKGKKKVFKFLKKNKFILSLVTITVIFMACDFILLNSFVSLLTKI